MSQPGCAISIILFRLHCKPIMMNSDLTKLSIFLGLAVVSKLHGFKTQFNEPSYKEISGRYEYNFESRLLDPLRCNE